MPAPLLSLWAFVVTAPLTFTRLSEEALIYSGLFGGAALLCLLGAWHARHLPNRDTRHGLMALLLASSLWASAQLVFLLADTSAVAYAAYTTGLVIGFSTVWAWLYFCSAYSGRDLHRRLPVVVGSALLFGGITLLKLTNSQHGLYFGISPSDNPLTLFAVDRYLLYWLTTTLSYALVLVGFFMLAELWLHVRGRTRAIVGLFSLMLLPIVGNALGLLVPSIADLYHEPLGVAAFALGVLFVARDQLVSVQEVVTRDKPALILGPNAHVRSYNTAAETLFPALQNQDALNQPLDEVLPEVAATRTAHHPVLKTMRNNTIRYYRIAESRLRTGGAPVHLLVLMDVTDRERQFREQEQLVQSITESVSDGILQVPFEHGIVYANQAMASMFGYRTPMALQTTPPSALFADPDVAQQVQSTLRRSGHFTGEVTFCRHNASQFVGRLSATLIRDDHGDPAYYNGVLVDLTVQKNRERALQAAKEEAETAARLKENLLATMNHEMRTPLTTIIGFSEVLTRQTNGATQRFAERIQRGGRRLEHTLESLLILSKLRSGTYTLHPTPLPLAPFVDDMIAQFEERAVANDLTLTTTAPPADACSDASSDAPPPRLDPNGCRHILTHLIDNALKFTPPGGTITVQAYRTDDSVHFVVQDTGIGIPADLQDAVFTPFKQVSEGPTRAYEGSGIGLAIVRDVTETMGGTVTLDSTEDTGSRVTVRIPLPIAPPPDAE